jgi:hypothetical protein
VVGSLYAAFSLRRQGQGAQSENEPPSEFAVTQQVTASYGKGAPELFLACDGVLLPNAYPAMRLPVTFPYRH